MNTAADASAALVHLDSGAMDAVAWAISAIVVLVAIGCGAGWARSRRALQDERRERLETEALLREAAEAADHEDRLRDLILGTMDEGVILVDGTGAIVFANDAVVRHLEASPSSSSELYPIELRDAVRGAIEGAGAATVEVQLGAPPRWLRATCSPAGDDSRVLVVVSDITERRRIDAVRRDFVTNASHELKTPVASIQAGTETLRDMTADDAGPVGRFAASLERDALRLSNIVSDLLDLSRLESGGEPAERIDLAALVEDDVAWARERAEAADVDLREILEPAAALGSPRDLRLLTRNLVDNAIRHTPSGGQVRVQTGVQGAEATLTVADSGEGIPSGDLARVFERFYRVDRARSRDTGGTGLGLAIARHVVENHGGSIEVESELGQGSTFLVRLPLAPTSTIEAR